jgi:hypothetical protein
MKRATTGEFVCELKNANSRGVFKIRGANVMYNRFILSLDFKAPSLNRLIRAKKMTKDGKKTTAIFAIRNDANEDVCHDDLLERFVRIIVGGFEYKTMPEGVEYGAREQVVVL